MKDFQLSNFFPQNDNEGENKMYIALDKLIEYWLIHESGHNAG